MLSEEAAMYIVYYRNKQWAVAWRYSSGEKHFVAAYPSRNAAKRAADRLNGLGQESGSQMNVLILCHGNRYRSPLCHAIVQKFNTKLHIRSRGFRDDDNKPAAKPVREYARKKIGLDLSEHRSVCLTTNDLIWADVIIYMDKGNKRRLEEKACGHLKDRHVFCLGEFVSPPVPKIPDPAFFPYQSKQFQDVMELVYNASRNLATYLTHNKLTSCKVPPTTLKHQTHEGHELDRSADETPTRGMGGGKRSPSRA
jgi:protein-tyrosine-phosphatase